MLTAIERFGRLLPMNNEHEVIKQIQKYQNAGFYWETAVDREEDAVVTKRDRQPILQRAIRTYAHTEVVYYVNGEEVDRLTRADTWLEDETLEPMSVRDFEVETGLDLSE